MRGFMGAFGNARTVGRGLFTSSIFCKHRCRERIAVGVAQFTGTHYFVDVIHECTRCKKLFKTRLEIQKTEMDQLITTTVIPTLYDILSYLDPSGETQPPEDRDIVPPGI